MQALRDAAQQLEAVLARRVSSLLQAYSPQVSFMAPDVAFADVQEHRTAVLSMRNAAYALAAGQGKRAALRAVVFFGTGVATWTTATVALYLDEGGPA